MVWGRLYYKDQMPLFKRTPFFLLDPPKDLDPKEKGWQSIHATDSLAYRFTAHLVSCVICILLIICSTLNLTDLVNKIYGSLQENLFEGLELHAKRDGSEAACKILKVIGSDEEQVVPVKYPIDDLLVKPVADDPLLSKRCPASTDFKVPISSVGDLLMVWDFCMSFGRLLCLSPFSLSDLENAICHKETNLVLLVEIHTALLNLLINDEGEYFEFIQNKNRKSKVSLVTWKEYLCDFMEMTSISSNISTVRRGHYGLVPTSLKLEILRELVDEAIATIAVKEKLDERIDQQHALAAEKREIARKSKEEQKLIMEVATEKEMNQANAVQDGNENVNSQLVAKEGNERKNAPTSKMGDAKLHLDGNGNVNSQLVAKEGKERKNAPASKMGDVKLHLGRHLEKELLDQSVRTSPLGKDRYYNRYWFFRREGRLFVESADSKEWGYYSTKEELDALIGSLNIKGIRERALKQQLDKFYNKISNAVEKRLKEVTHQLLVEEAVLRRSSRVHAHPKDSPSTSFLEYVNTWKPVQKRNRSKDDRAT
ncbi:hypothetical protein TRIUR3_33030 [Triticum urartu]|uniref:Uncharacterized protein n=1 Tax=Triticum urartu TaxID=4572 RepID=M8AGG2_TRIUA|nr:hypothetical protein TRIUR3_33030 [Triticum urartu]